MQYIWHLVWIIIDIILVDPELAIVNRILRDVTLIIQTNLAHGHVLLLPIISVGFSSLILALLLILRLQTRSLLVNRLTIDYLSWCNCFGFLLHIISRPLLQLFLF